MRTATIKKIVSILIVVCMIFSLTIFVAASEVQTDVVCVAYGVAENESSELNSKYLVLSSNLNQQASTGYHGYAGVLTGSKKRGISAKITMPSSLPDVSDSGESAWVSTSKDSNNEWVQAGARYYSSFTAFKTYTEHYQNGVYKLTTVGTHRLGIYLTYKVEYNSDDGKWHAFINSVDKVSSSLAATEIKVQAKGEVHKEDIEMGPFTFSTVKVKNSDGVWVDNTDLPTADSPYTATGSATSFTVSGP